MVGLLIGEVVGVNVGSPVGIKVGDMVGLLVAFIEGPLVGAALGKLEGEGVDTGGAVTRGNSHTGTHSHSLGLVTGEKEGSIGLNCTGASVRCGAVGGVGEGGLLGSSSSQ
jgi:hypothetical protein